MLKARDRIAGQARDEVHVDVLMARPPGIGIAVQDILRRVPAANARQHLVREGLGVDGNAGGTILFDDSQLFGQGNVRITLAARARGLGLGIFGRRNLFHVKHISQSRTESNGVVAKAAAPRTFNGCPPEGKAVRRAG